MNIEQLLEKRYTVKKFDGQVKLSEEQLSAVKKMLQQAPSSVNIQPWHFTIATTEEGKEAIAKSTVNYGFNDEKIRDAAALVVMSTVKISEELLANIIKQEEEDGRFPSEEYKQSTDNGRRYFSQMNENNGILEMWTRSQVYLNAGHLVMGASALGLDSVIMEGFDPELLSDSLNLDAKTPVLIVGLGIRAADDYNAALPKSRLDQSLIIDMI